ncbi:MAG: PKD domain-containing protein [Flavobacteriales bacterium]|nr:PKD domain-containing protein [Flavobacteriales bacterium]
MSIFCATLSFSQGWVTNNVNVVIKDNASIVIPGDSGNYINRGSGLVLTKIDGNIYLGGNWINNGTSPAIGNNAGTVILKGGGNQEITGTTSTSFFNLELSGIGNKHLRITTLVGGGFSGLKTGKLIMSNHNLILNSKTLILNNSSKNAISRSSGLLIGDTDPTLGYGKVQWNIRNASVGSIFYVPFGSIDNMAVPLIFEVKSVGNQSFDSGFVSLATYPTNAGNSPNNRPLPIGVTHLNNKYNIENDIKSVDRFFILNGGGYTVNPNLSIGFSYLDRELGGTNTIDETKLEAAKFENLSNKWNYDLKGSTQPLSNLTLAETTSNYEGAWVLHIPAICPIADFVFTNECFQTPMLFTDNSKIISETIDTSVWVYDFNELYNQNNLFHTFGSDGFFDVKRKVRGDRGCWDSITKQVQVFPLPKSSFVYSDTCLTDNVNFQSTSSTKLGNPINVEWQIESNIYKSPNVTHSFSTVGAKLIQLISSNTFGCKDTLLKNIEIEPIPIPDFSFNDVCEQQLADFQDLSTSKGKIIDWTWKSGGNVVSRNPVLSHQFNLPGTYNIQLAVENEFGCSDSTTRTLTVHAKANAKFDAFPKDIYITDPYVNFIQSGSNANIWQWRFGDFSDEEYGSEVFHQYGDTGLFSVRLIANNDFGCADTFYRTILIKPDLRIWIPNAFSPGPENDINKTFGPGGMLYGLKSMEMDIYNRWGELIYHSETIDKPWNGTYKGQLVQPGTYLYLMKIRDVYGNIKWYNGTVTVTR